MHRPLFLSSKFILLLTFSTMLGLVAGCAPKETTETNPSLPHMGLYAPDKKDIARQLIAAAENSSLEWREQFAFIQYNVEGNQHENRGYTAGIIGFTSRTHDMLALVEKYAQLVPDNGLAHFIPILKKVDGSPSREGLGPAFEAAWRQAARDPKFQEAQERECDRIYFKPAVSQAIRDGLRELGQFAYFDAIVMHGPGTDANSFHSIRAAALKRAKAPSQGGDEAAYLHAFLDARKVAMLRELGHQNTSRVDTMQRNFLNAGNLSLKLPLIFRVNNTSFEIDTTTSARP
jgi:chitosanase